MSTLSSLNRIIIVLTNAIPIDITQLTIGMHCQARQAIRKLVLVAISFSLLEIPFNLLENLNHFAKNKNH